MKRILSSFCYLVVLLVASSPVMAHPGHLGPHAGFAAGLLHPLTGLDHLAVMLAVGMWASLTMPRRSWLPVAGFLGAMLAGATLGATGMALPAVEAGIAASVLMMGLLLISLARLPATPCILLIMLFAVFHGNAHGMEMPLAADPSWYGLGFLLATGTLHLIGIAFGRVLLSLRASWLAGGIGLLTSVGGAWLLLSA